MKSYVVPTLGRVNVVWGAVVLAAEIREFLGVSLRASAEVSAIRVLPVIVIIIIAINR